MSRKILTIGVLAGASVVLLIFVSQSAMKNTIKPPASTSIAPENVEKKASFAIFTNGTFRIFTDPRYHNQSLDVYVSAENPNIVTVKKERITWRDFFKTLPMGLDNQCLVTGTGQRFCTGETGFLAFYINGEKTDNALDREISNGDKLLVSFGSQNEGEIKNQLSQIPEPNQ